MNANRFALASLSVALLAGCVEDRMPLEIQAVCYPTDDCSFEDECDATLIGSFTHYVATGFYLWIPVQVANQLPNNGDLATGRVNTNDAHVTGFEIDFSGAASGTAVIDWGNQWVPADGTSVLSIYVPTPSVDGFVYADIRLVGYYDNGRDFVTGNFHLGYAAVSTGAAPACPASNPVETCPGSGSQTPLVCGS